MNKKLTEIYNSIDIDMTSAVSDYKDPFHLLSLANLSDESPHIRTVVLRDFSMSKKIFEFHSDIRSPKVEQLGVNPNFSALFYQSLIHISEPTIRIKKYSYDFLEKLKYYIKTHLQKKDGKEYPIHHADVI